MAAVENADLFEEIRPKLIGLAYRMLGSLADAEDVVQDTFVKWSLADRQTIENPNGWLVTACTRRCIDVLRSAQRSRLDYVGAWLPEPLQTASFVESTENDLDLAGSLTTAFLLMLERLTAKERAAYLLHDVFEIPYREVAEILGIQESACRKLASRAKAHIGDDKARAAVPIERQDILLAAFQSAIATGATDRLSKLLSEDVSLSADGGGNVPAILNAVQGKNDVLRFIAKKLKLYWEKLDWMACELNGASGLVLRHGETIHATVSFSFDDDGNANGIFIMRNPAKLSRFATTTLE